MAELTLKDESVIQIGESVSKGFNDLVASGKSILINPAGQPLVSKADDISPTDDFIGPRLPETGAVTNDFIGPQLPESSPVMDLLGSIRDGIMSLVDTFTESLSFQKQEEREAERAERISADDPAPPPDEGTGFFTQDFKDAMMKRVESVKQFTAGFFGIFKGLFGKAALFGLLLAFALNLDKFSGKLTETIKPIVEGFKAAFESLKKDFVPVVEGLIEGIGLAFETISNIIQGIFNPGSGKFTTGIKQLLFDFPIKLVSIVGDAFFSLLDAALNLFGVDAPFIEDIKIAFRTLPEAIKKAITDTMNFFTETIPNFFIDLKNQAIENAKNNIAAITQMFKNAFNFITEDIPNYFSGLVDSVINSIKETVQSIKDAIMAPIKAIKEKVSGVFSSVTDFFTGGDEESKATAKSMAGESKRDTLLNMRDNLLVEGPVSDSQQAKNNFLKKLRSLNDALIKEDGLGNEHMKVNKIDPYNYAIAHNEGTDSSFVNQMLKSDNGNVEQLNPNSNMPTINPQDLNKGKQLNEGSVEIAKSNQKPSTNVISKGGDNVNTVANNSYTNISESTNTSDNSIRNYFAA